VIPPLDKVNPLSEVVAFALTRAIQIVFLGYVVVAVTVANPLSEAVVVDLAVVTKMVVVVAGANPHSEAVAVDLARVTKIVFHSYVVVVVIGANPLREAVVVDLAGAIKSAFLICFVVVVDASSMKLFHCFLHTLSTFS
jgi:hypothetical protein